MRKKPPVKAVKLSRDIDAINRPIEQKKAVNTQTVAVLRRRKRRPKKDYDDVLDEFWL